MTATGCDVLVVGAGVSGLTTGVCLAEHGLAVTILAEHPPAQTTSSVAGALWGPHLVETSERVAQWARETLDVLGQLATDPATGVRIANGVEATKAPGRLPPSPAWLTGLGRFRRCSAAELPDGFAGGWRYAAPMVHMPTYLSFLLTRFEEAGGLMQTGKVTSLATAAREHNARSVVNCTGAGAHDLVPDPALFPVRGQVVVAANPGLSDFFIGLGDAPDSLVYVFPHDTGTVVLGGTEQPGDWSLAPSPVQARRILRACAEAEPRLAGAKVIAHRVGLRPCRPRVRLEAETCGDGRPPAAVNAPADRPAARPPQPLVVHNYGHGGAGVTLSWGCAREAARAVTRRLG